MKGYIYKFTNKINNKAYIGQTRQKLKTRYRQHIRDSKKDTLPFHLALQKYGEEKFEFSVVEEIELDSKKELIDTLNKLEVKYIKKYNSLCPNGYNVQKGGNYYDIKLRVPECFRNETEYINEPVIDSNGIVYSNILEYCVKTNSDYDTVFYGCTNFCKKYFAEFHFVNYKTIKFRGECYPSNSTIEDVIIEKASLYVSFPALNNNELTETEENKEI